MINDNVYSLYKSCNLYCSYSGFIEELGQGEGPPGGGQQQPGHYDDNDADDHIDLGHVLGPLESLLPGLLGGGIGPRSTFQPGMRGPSHIRISSRGPMGPRPGPGVPGGPQHLGMDQAALENALQVLHKSK